MIQVNNVLSLHHFSGGWEGYIQTVLRKHRDIPCDSDSLCLAAVQCLSNQFGVGEGMWVVMWCQGLNAGPCTCIVWMPDLWAVSPALGLHFLNRRSISQKGVRATGIWILIFLTRKTKGGSTRCKRGSPHLEYHHLYILPLPEAKVHFYSQIWYWKTTHALSEFYFSFPSLCYWTCCLATVNFPFLCMSDSEDAWGRKPEQEKVFGVLIGSGLCSKSHGIVLEKLILILVVFTTECHVWVMCLVMVLESL